ncbi:PAS domain-containing protein [Natronolimnobius sp. AArcel1]|uniref:PAS domain-containing protein n=1 Tax=Natronolimnobius sp. AArcel1 TaxID=1679093 RepID=UPI0013EAAFB2|nr:PAS domain-containing protein [Natronolimnobius sp. AArcel1]NGM70787.1 PAS domain-containing protein [Natronolimnobius sp. AArcel1]
MSEQAGGSAGAFWDDVDGSHARHRLSALLTAVTDGIVTFDTDGTLTTANDRAADILGRSQESLHGCAHDDDRFDLVNETGTPLESDETPFSTLLESDGSITDQIVGITIPTGERVWLSVNGALDRTDEGIAGAVFTVEDITERKERTNDRTDGFHDIRENEEHLRLALESGSMGTWELDLQTEDSPVRSAEHDRIFGYDDPLEDWGIDRFLEHVHPDDRELVEQRFEAAMESGTWEFDCRIIRADGEQRTITATGEFQFDADGKPVRAVGIVQDITDQRDRERYLEEAKAQLEAATEAGAVGTWEWQVPENRFVTGASFARTFGVEPAAAREGVPLERITASIHEADRERVTQRIQDALETCGEYEAEYRVWDADGELRWVVARGHVECDEDGNPRRFPGALTDITERKRAELAVEKQSRELEALFQVLPVGVVVANADGSLRRANETAKEIWGGDVFNSDSVEEYEKFDANWADSGEPVEPNEWTMAQVLDGESVTDPNIYEIDTFDGEQRIIMEHGQPVRTDDGSVSRAVVTVTDITERRQYEQALEENRRQLSTLMENVPGMVYRCQNESDWPMEFVSDACRELTGYDPEALESGKISYGDEIMLEEDRAEVWSEIQQLSGEQDTFSVAYRIETADGDIRWVRSYGRAITDDDGTIVSLEGIISDITDRKQLETDLKASNERLEQFAYAASHDLQEPLRMVTSYLQLLESRYGDEFDEDGQEFLEFAVDGANRMRAMIDALLKYSRVDTRGDPFEPVDLDAVLADVRDDLQMQINETGAAITASSLPDVHGDSNQLRQVFQNLLQNALQYSGEEPPEIAISADRKGEYHVISVCDRGVGIETAHTERIFEVFQRLHSHQEHPGTGIGLALCRRIVERHGGEIWAESNAGDGTTFSFTLPVEP